MLKIVGVLGWLVICLMADSTYWLVDEFFKAHPEQKEKMERFDFLIQAEAIPIKNPPEKPVKITIVYPGEQISDYWRRSKQSFAKRMDELRIPYVITDYNTKPAVEIGKQARLIYEAVRSDTDYLVFTMDAKKHQRLIEQILARQKPKLILQNITTPLKAWGRNQPMLYVGFDHVIGTEKLLRWYLSHFPTKARYSVLYGPMGYVSRMRGDLFIQRAQKVGQYALESSYYTDFKREKARTAALQILEQPSPPDFIYACSTDIAIGVTDALKQSGQLGKVMTNGWGGGESELAAIRKKELDVTVMRMNDDNGIAMAEAIKWDLEGKSDAIPTVYSGSFEIIDQLTDSEQIERLKRRAFRYSGE